MKNGNYELVHAPENYPGKRYRNKYAYEHTVVFWKKYGFVPKKGFEIHHINGNHRDNRIQNLKLLTSKKHKELHGSILSKRTEVTFNCGFCDKKVNIKGSKYRTRMKLRKFSKLFCSISCGAKHQFRTVGCRSR